MGIGCHSSIAMPLAKGRRPPLAVEALRAAARALSWRTGTGAGSWHPREFDYLSGDALQGLVCLCMAMESLGHVPIQECLQVVAFIPTAKGGSRPSGLIVGLLRVLAQARNDVVQDWEARHGDVGCFCVGGHGAGLRRIAYGTRLWIASTRGRRRESRRR